MIHDCVITIGESHMSRTYRRKNSPDEWWVCSDTIWYNDGTWIDLPPTKRDLSRYHSDSTRWIYPGLGSAGKIAKKIFARSMRFKNKEILDASVRDCNDEPMFIPYYHPYR